MQVALLAEPKTPRESSVFINPRRVPNFGELRAPLSAKAGERSSL